MADRRMLHNSAFASSTRQERVYHYEAAAISKGLSRLPRLSSKPGFSSEGKSYGTFELTSRIILGNN